MSEVPSRSDDFVTPNHPLICPFNCPQWYFHIQIKIYVPKTTVTIEEWMIHSKSIAYAVFNSPSSSRQVVHLESGDCYLMITGQSPIVNRPLHVYSDYFLYITDIQHFQSH